MRLHAVILQDASGWWKLIPPLDRPDNPSWYPSAALAFVQCRLLGWPTLWDLEEVPLPEEAAA